MLPGVHLATGPMGQGLGVAQGFAIAGRSSPRFDSYCLTGDGELQEGPIWEAVMYAGQKHLDNLCVLVDRNNGQLDIANRMVFPMPELERGVRVVRLDSAQRRRHAVRRRLRRARDVPVRPAQRQADGDHLPRHEGARRALRFPEQAQGHGAGRDRRAGDSRSRPSSAATASTSSTRSSSDSPSRRWRRRCSDRFVGCARRHAPRRLPRLGRRAVARPGRSDRCGPSARPRAEKRVRCDAALLPASIPRRSTRPAIS